MMRKGGLNKFEPSGDNESRFVNAIRFLRRAALLAIAGTLALCMLAFVVSPSIKGVMFSLPLITSLVLVQRRRLAGTIWRAIHYFLNFCLFAFALYGSMNRLFDGEDMKIVFGGLWLAAMAFAGVCVVYEREQRALHPPPVTSSTILTAVTLLQSPLPGRDFQKIERRIRANKVAMLHSLGTGIIVPVYLFTQVPTPYLAVDQAQFGPAAVCLLVGALLYRRHLKLKKLRILVATGLTIKQAKEKLTELRPEEVPAAFEAAGEVIYQRHRFIVDSWRTKVRLELATTYRLQARLAEESVGNTALMALDWLNGVKPGKKARKIVRQMKKDGHGDDPAFFVPAPPY